MEKIKRERFVPMTETKKPAGRPPNPMPEPIPDTIENVARHDIRMVCEDSQWMSRAQPGQSWKGPGDTHGSLFRC